MVQGRYVFPFSQLRMTDVDRVGGKNASLGELLSQLTDAGIRVPDGFATTAEAFRLFIKESGLEDRIAKRLAALDVEDVKALAEAGAEIRRWIEEAPFPAELEKEIRAFYEWLKDGQDEISVAVRSSATAEDLPDASFAGQQETYLNVVGIDQVLSRFITTARSATASTRALPTWKWRFPRACRECAARIKVPQASCLRLTPKAALIRSFL